ncbi:50S ribosomal protein L31 [candidate division WWE3 bacterium CG06_land_8_20_14_3_00_42_16]|uniref:Large ribosomal subunit protein bL31 n=4 Tax=Katanobacteria TaxID=422282 RepID=A0A2M7ALZ1_UNCKA|nr:MAG: 50S ribosomal protein L31 [candidate division WWE3 bacterium CG06_land_8_20_14_3_00_42_16]PIZ43796.1 MAG: 50S ribosomal protein L31 [candidate division WWE3 bacterium CG_4_10_14_0_2_um_filter_42_8]PJA37745.1 MAG: 50S ribosomal protein L31 [candidate division WWE3 bacterium CG_4_9_14_3_um_filter_43_9]PJC68411.1 MAG: 50S ribosomal protein L31 [candidate division WWE3 bacterium CG_4_8_14_3_um_filter_42_11]
MKKDIHPTYYHDCKVTCACGNTFITGSTKKEIRVEICSACHPFFTGQQKFIDTEGRVDKFIRLRKEAEARQNELNAKIAKRKAKDAENTKEERPKSLREMLQPHR